MQRAGCAQDGIGDGHLADIVQESAARNDPNAFRGNTHSPGNSDSKGRYTFGMAFSFGILKVQRVAQSFQSDVIGALQIGHGLSQLFGARRHQRFQVGLISPVFQP